MRVLLRRSSVRGALRDTDCIAGDDQVDSAVLRTAAGGGVIRDWLRLAIASCRDVVWLNPLRDEEVPDRVGPVLRELLVVFVTADDVGVAFHLNFETRVGLQDSGDFCKADLSTGLQRVPAGVEENIGHIDDEASS